MSAIAAFYVVPDERLPDVVAAAAPAKAGWFRPARSTFRETLRASGRELEAFGWSGWAFNMLDIYLRNRHGIVYDNFGDADATRKLTARGSYWLVLPTKSAAALLADLNGIECPFDDIVAEVVTEHGAEGANEEAKAVQAALVTLKAWLSKVTPGSAGLLSVG